MVNYQLNTNETCQKVPFRGFRGKRRSELSTDETAEHNPKNPINPKNHSSDSIKGTSGMLELCNFPFCLNYDLCDLYDYCDCVLCSDGVKEGSNTNSPVGDNKSYYDIIIDFLNWDTSRTVGYSFFSSTNTNFPEGDITNTPLTITNTLGYTTRPLGYTTRPLGYTTRPSETPENILGTPTEEHPYIKINFKKLK